MASPSEDGGGLEPSRSRVLITGIEGFTGQHLAALLRSRGLEVHGTVLGETACDPFHHRVDLLDGGTLTTVVATVRPTHVVHLAAISFVAHGDAEQIYRTNIAGTRNLLQALAGAGHRPRSVLLASSANIYGNAAQDPIDEDVAPHPANDYAVSKLAMEHMAALWADRLPITLVRPFNYTGVGQSSQFLIPKIVEAFRRRAPTLELGNIDVERDFSDVRDVVEAYVRLLAAAPGGTYNVCSGEGTSLRAILDLAEEISGHALQVVVNPAFVRANEIKRLRGSGRRLQSVIGGWPRHSIRATIEWMLSAA